MRWPFRREPSGKHALGAAVTAIPAGPVVPVRQLPVDLPTVPVQALQPLPAATEPAPVPVQAVPPSAVPVQAVAPVAGPATSAPLARDLVAAPPVPPPAPTVVTESLPAVTPFELVVEPPAAWVPTQPDGTPLFSAPPVEADAPVRTVPVDLPALPVQPAAPVAPVPAAVEAPTPVEPVCAPPPAPGLDALLAAAQAVESTPTVAPPVAAPPAPQALRQGTRVELGFADGSFRMLDPNSDTARALSELVGELTGSGEPPSGRGSGAR